jgi:lysophospholipase L1-like esterase
MAKIQIFMRAALLTALAFGASSAPAAQGGNLELKKGDHVVLIGNTLAERMQQFGHFETLLHSRFPELNLVVRNLGWSADGVNVLRRLRSENFQDHGNTLRDHDPDVILAFFGFNESFAGPAGLDQFKADLATLIADLREQRYGVASYPRGSQTPNIDEAQGPAEKTPRIVLFSPIAHEDLGNPDLPDGSANNKNLELYTRAMAEVAKKHNVPFVDLFAPSKRLMAAAREPLTINGVHLNDRGYRQLAPVIDQALFGSRPAATGGTPDLEKLRAEILEKNLQFWYDYRAINGCYIYGGRKEPFGVVNFPAEFAKLRKMTANRDARVWALAQGKSVPAKIDDGNTGEFVKVETNFKKEIHITPPEEARKKLKVAEGYEINLFASEEDFPDLQNPVQFAFDARGRLWVVTMPSYPMYLPGTPVNDKVLILEDTDGDGRADKQTVFADGLYVPTGIALGDGGVYVAQQPNLVFLKDTDGDDKADVKRTLLHGFDTADSHHAISAFVWGPGGALYFEEGTFLHTQVETPYGPVRCANAAIYRYEPRTEKLDTFVSTASPIPGATRSTAGARTSWPTPRAEPIISAPPSPARSTTRSSTAA